ncbi:MAG: enhanced entry protein EnhB [Gammaproteobacteria bacterium]|nr:enhanced entry protein EnhB [Gammaproteobacteria bacterium]MCH9762804.1 enhanced entry protein EnhB [Gammaproteobacteria bacterium]
MSLFRPILYSISILLFTPSLLFAFPKGCESSGFGFDDPYVIFNDTGNQTFYLIQNHSDLKIELQRVETEDTFMSPKLQSKLNPDRWSAFASDTSNVHFQCLSHANKTPTRISCHEVLTICQYPRVKFALSNMGSYWVSTNKPQGKVIRDSIKKGILLRW